MTRAGACDHCLHQHARLYAVNLHQVNVEHDFLATYLVDQPVESLKRHCQVLLRIHRRQYAKL